MTTAVHGLRDDHYHALAMTPADRKTPGDRDVRLARQETRRSRPGASSFGAMPGECRKDSACRKILHRGGTCFQNRSENCNKSLKFYIGTLVAFRCSDCCSIDRQ